MESFITVNTDRMEPPQSSTDLFVNRASFAEMQQQSNAAEVSIIVTAYNRLEKTRRCVESILKYTQGIDYELILMDNGSTDKTLDYFQSVAYSKKKIVHISRNLGGTYANMALNIFGLGRFVATIPNDLIVTTRWLDNLLRCLKSDPKIGMVNPVSSNVSNHQGMDFPYRSYQEMQEKAARMNRSDPRKWEDRLRLITLGPVYRKEVLLGLGWPLGDVGFFHDFGDDDTAFQIRRLGYRTVLAGDTWVCHDHAVMLGEGKDPAQFQQSLETGRANFQEKYFGVDAWEDVNNYYIPYLSHLPSPRAHESVRILGVDVQCGTPVLDIKNWLRRNGVFLTELSAFTQDPKYWMDLKTICQGPVYCDREEFLQDCFQPAYFDYVVADRPFNRYHEPQKILADLLSLCKPGGIVLCKLKNTFSFQEYVHLLGERGVYSQEFAYNIPLGMAVDTLQRMGAAVRSIVAIPYPLDAEQIESLGSLLPEGLEKGLRSDLMTRMICDEYLLVVEKGGGS